MAQNAHYNTNFIIGGLVGDYAPVTPNDSTDLDVNGAVVGLYIETGGTLVVRTARGGDTSRTIEVASFTPLTLSVTRVLATGTTATGIHALVQ